MLRECLRWHDVELPRDLGSAADSPRCAEVWLGLESLSNRSGREVGEFDIGIMPMPDDPWARGKCAFKAALAIYGHGHPGGVFAGRYQYRSYRT